jgi:hypothetical protein
LAARLENDGISRSLLETLRESWAHPSLPESRKQGESLRKLGSRGPRLDPRRVESGYTRAVSSIAAAPGLLYALAVGGAGLAFLNALTVFRTALNTRAFLAVARKNAEAGQHGRLRKLVAIVPKAEVMELTRRWLELDLEAVVLARSPGAYREAAPIVPLEERTRAALRPYVDERRSRLLARLPLSVVGACLAATAVALGHDRSWIPTLGAIGGLLALYGIRGIVRLRRDLLTAFDVLVTLPRPTSDDGAEPAEPEPGEQAASSGRPSRLVMEGADGVRREFPLEVGMILKIGKLPSAQVKLEGEGVSRIHAVVEVRDDGVTLIDLGSHEGTRVDGEPITKRTLAVGDRVTIGDHELVAR